MTQQRTIGICIFDGAEELDWAGPWEVLAAWASEWPDDNVRVVSIVPTSEPVTCAKGLRVLGDCTHANAPHLELLVYPGGRGTRAQIKDPDVLALLRGYAERGTIIASVCTGSLVLAKAGLLDGLPATTHHSALDLLGQLGNDIDVRREERFVDNGSIVTAAGVSAGIDMALHLIARMHSIERAREVRRYIQYDPDPPV